MKFLKRIFSDGGPDDAIDHISPERSRRMDQQASLDAAIKKARLTGIGSRTPDYSFVHADNPRIEQQITFVDHREEEAIRRKVEATVAANDAAHRARLIEIGQRDKKPRMTVMIEPHYECVCRREITIGNEKLMVPFFGVKGFPVAEAFIQFGEGKRAQAIIHIRHNMDLETYLIDPFTHPENISSTMPSPFAQNKPMLAKLRETHPFQMDPMPMGDPDRGVIPYAPPDGSFWAHFNNGTSSKYSAGEAAQPDTVAFRNGMNEAQLKILLAAYQIHIKNPRKARDYINDHYALLVPREVIARRAHLAGQHAVYQRIGATPGAKLPVGVSATDIPPTGGGVHPATQVMYNGTYGASAEDYAM